MRQDATDFEGVDFESAGVLLYHCSHVVGRFSLPKHFTGAVAQLGERMTGSHEVRGSIPLGSTIFFSHLKHWKNRCRNASMSRCLTPEP